MGVGEGVPRCEEDWFHKRVDVLFYGRTFLMAGVPKKLLSYRENFNLLNTSFV